VGTLTESAIEADTTTASQPITCSEDADFDASPREGHAPADTPASEPPSSNKAHTDKSCLINVPNTGDSKACTQSKPNNHEAPLSSAEIESEKGPEDARVVSTMVLIEPPRSSSYSDEFPEASCAHNEDDKARN
jgi:hypothetical protein